MTLTESPLCLTRAHTLRLHHFSVADRTWDHPEHTAPILDILMSCRVPGRKALVHCLGGVGRTNTVARLLCFFFSVFFCRHPHKLETVMKQVLACYLMVTRHVPPSEAVSVLVGQRKTILAAEQTMYLKSFYGQLHAGDPTRAPHGSHAGPTRISALPRLLMLVGAPCSGKSTFSMALLRACPDRVVHISQVRACRSP